MSKMIHTDNQTWNSSSERFYHKVKEITSVGYYSDNLWYIDESSFNPYATNLQAKVVSFNNLFYHIQLFKLSVQ